MPRDRVEDAAEFLPGYIPDDGTESPEITFAALPPALRVPSTVRVGTVTYRVTTDRDAWMRIEHSTQTNGYFGHSQHREAIIYLNPDAAPEVNRLTLWHEVLHALDETVMGNPDWRSLNGDPQDADAAEETVVRMLEHPTLAVLRDNPSLVAYLTAND